MAYRFIEEEPEDQETQPVAKPQRFKFVEEEAKAPTPTQTKKKNTNPFATEPVSPEQYQNMSFWEKIKYAEALEKEQKYEESKAFSKNFLSGATFGATENIEGFKPEEGENPVAGFAGELLGSAIPITGIGKAVGYGLKGATKAIQNGPKILEYLNRFAHGFGTGSIYESGKQAVNAASGNETNISQIPVTGALFGAGESLIQAAGDLGRKFLKFSPAQQAQILEEGIIPKDLSKSQYETAEQMLELVRQKNKGNFPEFKSGETTPLNKRVSPAGEDLGLRPVPQKVNPDLPDQVGNIFSKNKFYNTTQGGHAFRNEIMQIDENVYRGVNELYKVSRDLNSKITEIHPNLVGKLQNRIRDLKAIPEPSDVQKRLLRASENILERLATVGENGEINGYMPISNQVLIDQVQSLRQIIDYDFSHGNTKNIFRPLINDLQDSALRAAESSGTPEAAQAINQAKNSYRMWVEAFDNDYVRPFRDSSNQDYSKLFKSALDLDESNMLRRILNTTPKGQELIDASTRDIVEKHLSKFFDNPKDFTSREFDKAIRELEAVITPEQAKQVRNTFKEASKGPSFKAKSTNEEVIASKYLNKEPEYVQQLMNSRSGIKQLRKDFSGTQQKRELFDTLSKKKMRSILREGNIEKDFTGDDLYKFLNKEHNYEIFSEILGEPETEALRQSAKEIGREQVKNEVRNKKLSKLTKNILSFKAMEVVLGIL